MELNELNHDLSFIHSHHIVTYTDIYAEEAQFLPLSMCRNALRTIVTAQLNIGIYW